MFTTLLSVVVVLVLGHLAHGLSAALRDHGWFHGWLRWLDGKCAADGIWHGPWGIGMALVPILLLLALFQFALDGVLSGLPSLLLSIDWCCSTVGGRAIWTTMFPRSLTRLPPSSDARRLRDCIRKQVDRR